MIRTQIYLNKDLHRDLSILAKQERGSMAKVARDILREGIQRRKQIDKSGKGVLRKLLAIQARGGPFDLSKNLGQYLYGAYKKYE